MRKLKLFFACLLMAVLSIGQMWATDYYVKVTTAPSDWAGDYLIVYETGNVAFDGSLTTLDAVGNTKAVTITNGKIEATAEMNAIKFTISADASESGWYQLKSASGYYIAGTTKTSKASNGLKSNNTEANKSNYLNQPGVGQILSKSSDQNMTLRYNSASDQRRFRYFKSGQQAIALYKFEAGSSDACAAPAFLPAAGTVVSGTTVALSCATAGATIHYTTDGSTPTASSATFSAPITVNANMTIKAIAVKAGLDNSSVASAAYTALTPLTTMDQIFAAATSAGSTATPVAITFNNWVVTGVKNSNAYVTDGTKGFIVYTSSHGFQVGDILSGTAVCKVQLYNGSAELTELTASKVTVNTGGSVSPVVLDAEGIAALTGANTGSVIKISGECTYESSKYYIAGLQLYNQLYSFSVSAGTNYECTGVYVQYNTTKEILPRSAADIEAQTSVANPTFSPAGGEYTEVQNVTLSCTTNGATIYYTTDGSTPTNESAVYSSAIEVNASMTIKAIAYKGEDHSEVVSAAYTINLPIPSHDFQITHNFTTGEGFEFPTGWGGSYAEHEIVFTDDKVYFASASHQTGTITDRPVTKDKAIELILTNSAKIITAVRFDYSQWGTKTQTFVMKYSTDGGTTYKAFDPAVTASDFAIQTLSMPENENVNAIQVTGTNSSSQVGLTSIAFDLDDKPIVTKTVTITAPTNGTLVVKDGDDPITSGADIEVGTTLTIVATPAEGYKLTEVTVNGSAYAESTLTLTENVTIAATFEENLAPEVETYILSEAGVETSHLVSGMRVGDKVNLPLTAAECSKVFRGWDANAECATAPTYAPGEEYELALNNKLYAVYATPGDDAAIELFATTSLGSTNTVTDGYAVSAQAGAQSGYYQDGGSVGNKRYVQVMVSDVETQIITAQPSAITVTANIGGGSTNDNLTNPVYAVLLNAAGEEIGDPVALTSAIEVQTGKAYTENLPTANYVDVRGVRIYHVKENKGSSGYNVRYYAISLSYSAESYSDYSTDCQAQVATPTFSPVAGTYTEVQTVAISTKTADATIYYTTDGTTPTNESTKYTAAISVGEDMTIKAIAVKSGMVNSAVASADYTINLPLSTMDQIFAAATAAGSTATDANIAFGNWVVSGVSTNGKNVFVTDGTKGFIIFDNGGEMGFAVGDVLSGTAACKVQLFKGAAELTTLSSSTEGLNVATGGVITPAAKAISELGGINTGAPVIINSVQFDGTNLSDGANEIKPFKSLFAYDDLTENSYYNVTGIYQQYDATKEILPRSASDIEEVNLEDPELSYTPTSATIELGQDLPATVFANPHELAISYSTNNEVVATVSNAGVISLAGGIGTATITASFAGNAQYAAGNATFTITVTPASVSENVVVLAEHNSKFYAMTTTITNETAVPVEVEYDGTKVTVAKDADKDAIQWTKKTIGENITFQTKDEDKLYLKGTSGGATLSLNATACNWAWDGTNNCYVTGTRGFIYRISTNGFKNYGVSNLSNADYVAPQVIAIDPENIVITSKADPQLAYDPTSVTLTVGQTLVPAVLGYAEGFDGLEEVTYASSNENVATVDENGEVSLVADATGTTTITATFAGNDNYLAGNASYTITVNEVGDNLDGNWVLASQADIKAGVKIIIEGANGADIYTMGKQNTNPNRAAVVSMITNGVLTPGKGTKVFTLVNAGDGKFAIQASNGKYLSSATSGTSNNLIEADNYTLDNAKWTIAPTSVVAAAGNKNVMQYNSGSTLFSCYGSATQKPVNIYVNKKEINSDVDATEIPAGSNVIINGDVEMTIDQEVSLGDIYVKDGQTLTIEASEDATLGNLDLENGAVLDLDVTPGATVTANDLILRSNSADRNAQQGKSSQAPGVLPAINGVLALEIDLRPELAADATLSVEQSEMWYCISAPFEVDINSGFEWVYPDGHRTPMVHNVDFQIFEYDGARHATGLSGWKRIGGTMKAGVAHFIGFDNARTNQKVIRLTAKTNVVVDAEDKINLGSYPGVEGLDNWNGVANPTLQYIGIDKEIVAFDYGIQDYNPYAYTGYNYFVGSPFFIQQDGGSIAIDYNDRGGAIHAPKLAEDKLEYCVRINAAGANCFDGQMYVRASETASNSYEEGHDLASQCSTTPKYGARIWTENYNVRLGIEEAPLTNGNATYVLGIATPSAGEYTISVAAPKENADLYLTYNGSIIWNLSDGAYTVDLAKGVTSGYGLVLQAKAPHVATGVDNAEANEAGVQKVIINNHVYILRAEQMYDVTGKMVK